MKQEEKKLYFATIFMTIILLTVILIQNIVSFYQSAAAEAQALGESSLAAATEELESYINKGMNTLMSVSYSVEYMMENGAGAEEVEQYLLSETSACINGIEGDFQELYGVIKGRYVDGIGWVPGEDFVPSEREWYKRAIAAKGAAVLVPPYLDARTGGVIFAVSRMLSDGESVISLDIVLDSVQTYAEGIHLNNKGFGFIITSDGLVVAHLNETEKGKNYFEDPSTSGLASQIVSCKDPSFRYNIDGGSSTVFVNTLFDYWHVVMVVGSGGLLDGFTYVIIRDVIISIVIVAIVLIFYSFTFSKMNDLIDKEETSRAKLEVLNNSIIKALAHTIDAKDRYTSGHSQRVANYSLEIAKRAGKSEEEQQIIYCAGLLHDVGKIRVPEEVINKPGRLTDEEFSQIKIHPITSYHILKDIYEQKEISEGAKFHHERYDGNGYPNGLKGDTIPEIARIIGVADAYDAMASNRSYRRALPQNVVREEIEKGRGKQFDPQFADIMLKMIDEDTDYKMCEGESAERMILVVDDDKMVHKMVSAFTEDEPNYKVESAFSGEEALNILDSHHADIVLLDINLPGMNGFEAVKKIRERSSVPIVFLTGDKKPETIEAVSKADVADYITKPFLPTVLREVIHSVLN